MKNLWHEQQEKILKKWSEIGSSYRFMHDRAYFTFEKQNFRFALPVIVLNELPAQQTLLRVHFLQCWQSVPLFRIFKFNSRFNYNNSTIFTS